MPAPGLTTREDWVQVGYELLNQRGLDGVSVERIAANLGSSRSGFYHRFTDRHELLEAIVDHWMADGYALIGEYDHIDDPLQRYCGVIAGLLKTPRLRQADTALLLLATDDPGFSARKARVRNDFIVLGGQLLRESGMPAELAEERALFVWIGYLGILSEIDSRPESPSDEELEALVEQLIERAIA